jgi:hypothetical protein
MSEYVCSHSTRSPATSVKSLFARTAASRRLPILLHFAYLVGRIGGRGSKFGDRGMRRRLRNCAPIRASYWVGCAAGLLFAQAASAQTQASGAGAVVADAAISQARIRFNEGTDRARHGDWPEALVAFERSEALHPHPVTVYNIGYCERALGRSMRARKMFGKALADNVARGGVELPEELATAAQTYLGELEQQVAHTVISISPEGASIAVDGRPLERAVVEKPRPVLWAGTQGPGPGEPAMASTFELELDAGDHVFVVSKEGYVDEVTIRRFEPGDEPPVVLKLLPRTRGAVAPTTPPSARAGVEEAAVSGGAQRAIGLTIGGAGLIGIVAGVIAAVIAKSTYDEGLNDNCGGSPSTCSPMGAALGQSAHVSATAATVLLATGTGVLGAGAIVFFTAPKSKTGVRAAVALAPATVGAGVSVAGSF